MSSGASALISLQFQCSLLAAAAAVAAAVAGTVGTIEQGVSLLVYVEAHLFDYCDAP